MTTTFTGRSLTYCALPVLCYALWSTAAQAQQPAGEKPAGEKKAAQANGQKIEYKLPDAIRESIQDRDYAAAIKELNKALALPVCKRITCCTIVAVRHT
ncbi:MAG: hypothetical protein QM811_20815 [Pirellulales bacterium]